VNVDSIVTQVVAAIAIAIGLSYAVGKLFRRMRQPEVIGQLFVGIALGPSLLGRFSSSVTHTLFPARIVPYLNVTSQVALVLFLFAIGYELNLRMLRKYRRTVSVLSISTFAVPMLLGVASVYVFASWYRAAGEPHAGTAKFILFMGVAVSITAVPVLASITGERGIAATAPGATAMTSAALIDALGWLALAGVLVVASASSSAFRPWTPTVLLLVGYITVMLFIVRPALRLWLRRPHAVLADKVPVAVVVAMGSAWVSAALGLHVIFGAFFAGVMMPRPDNDAPDADILRPVLEAGRLLLPVFFVVSGLSVNVGALRAQDLALFGVVCAIAISGKAGVGFLAAWATGMGKRDSSVVGVLLNTRGLTELIALNVGLQAGIIHPRLYTILVLMALAMTAATGPLLTLIGSHEPSSATETAHVPESVVIADGSASIISADFRGS
jgi:Kef-type K+ transport system membrane component KefB